MVVCKEYVLTFFVQMMFAPIFVQLTQVESNITTESAEPKFTPSLLMEIL